MRDRFSGAVYLVLITIAAIVVAFLSTRIGFERDFSHASGASLSPATIALLKTLDAPVEVVSYASKQGGLRAIIDAGARLQGVDNGGINYLALPTHVEPFFRGLVASVDIVYFVLIAVVALALTARRLDRLRVTGG